MKIRTDTRAGASCYTVQSGDSLSTIAGKFYGEPALWSDVQKIYYSNMTTIGENPSLIRPGQKLYIPE